MARQAVIGLRTMMGEHPNGKVGGSEKINDSRGVSYVAFFCVVSYDSKVHRCSAWLMCNGTSTKAIVEGVRKLTNTCCVYKSEPVDSFPEQRDDSIVGLYSSSSWHIVVDHCHQSTHFGSDAWSCVKSDMSSAPSVDQNSK
jgi:hypothetical protein